MKLYPRSLYIKLTLFFVFFLYFVRFITLAYEPESYQFIRQFGQPEISTNFYIGLCAFFIFLTILSYIIPKTITLSIDNKFRYFFQKVFYVEFILLVVVILLGVKSGTNQGFLDKLVIFFVYSVIPYNLCYFVLVLTGGKNKLNTFLFFIPSILMASKSGIIYAVLLFITAKILKREKIISWKVIVPIVITIALYPLLFAISIYYRVGGVSVESVIMSMGDNLTSIYEFILISISRRVSGIDVLLIPEVLNNVVFSPESVAVYFLKGLTNAGLIDAIQGHNSIGIGRQFAIEFFGQSISTPNGFEPTLFGILYHSNNVISVSFVLFFTVILLFLFFRYRKDAFGKVMLCYLIFTFCLVIMSGTIIQLTQIIKFYILTNIIYFLYVRIFYNRDVN